MPPTWAASSAALPGARLATTRLSWTVMVAKRLGTWNFRAMPRSANLWSGSPIRSRPSNRMVPETGRWVPASMLNSVLFPAPLGPMMQRVSPRSSVRLTPPTAVMPPKCMCRSSACISATVTRPPSREAGVRR